jgi:hypothetical protein
VAANLVFVPVENQVVHRFYLTGLKPCSLTKIQVVVSCEVIAVASIVAHVLLRLQLAMGLQVDHRGAKDCYDSDLQGGWSLAIVADERMHLPLKDAPKVTFDLVTMSLSLTALMEIESLSCVGMTMVYDLSKMKLKLVFLFLLLQSNL